MNTENTYTYSVATSYFTGYSLSLFLSALVQANLQPVIQSCMPAPVVKEVAPSLLTGNELNDFLASLQPQIERIATGIYYKVYSVSLALDDLIQVGLIGAWKCTQKYDASKVKSDQSLRAYCLRRARGEILNHIKAQFKTPTTSLDAYLEPNQNTGYTRQIADTKQPLPTSKFKRRKILAALRGLTSIERASILAAYRIADTNGKSPLPEELHLTDSAYYNARARATKKLQRLMNVN